MATKNETIAVDAAPKSNGGLLASLGLADAVFKTREQLAADIVNVGNGEIVTLERIFSAVETVKWTNDYDEEDTFDALRIEMPAGALRIINVGTREEPNYTIGRAEKPFKANSDMGNSTLHAKGATKVLCELVAPGATSMLSNKTNDKDYMIVVYHIL